jgi:hypothetical protein
MKPMKKLKKYIVSANKFFFNAFKKRQAFIRKYGYCPVQIIVGPTQMKHIVTLVIVNNHNNLDFVWDGKFMDMEIVKVNENIVCFRLEKETK